MKAILEVGRLLAEAKEALPHGAFGRMIDTDLPFTARTAQMLMAIGADPRITNAKYVSHLPASWGTLYELTKLDDKTFDEKLADGTIRPDMMRRDIIAEEVAVESRDAQLPANDRVVAPRRVEPKDSRDYAPTPPWATRALMEIVLPTLTVQPIASVLGSMWEPAAGEGHISGVLEEYGQTIASDIADYGSAGRMAPAWWRVLNFLDDKETVPAADWIITNPPFNKAEEFALRAIALANDGVAMFVRWQWIEGVGRYDRLFNVHPPTLVCPFAERVPLHMGRWEPDGDTMTAYCWVVWFKRSPAWGTGLPTLLRWIPPGQRLALTRPDDRERFTAHPVIARSSIADDGSPTNPLTGEISEAAE